MQIIYIFLGGGIGSVLRYGIAWLLRHLQLDFPVATLTANGLSCILLGFLAGISTQGFFSPSVRAFFIIGVCGGFSTFSTFSYETLTLLQTGKYSSAFANMSISITVCLICLLLGMKIAKNLI